MDTMLYQWVWILAIKQCFTACTTKKADCDFEREVGGRGQIGDTLGTQNKGKSAGLYVEEEDMIRKLGKHQKRTQGVNEERRYGGHKEEKT